MYTKQQVFFVLTTLHGGRCSSAALTGVKRNAPETLPLRTGDFAVGKVPAAPPRLQGRAGRACKALQWRDCYWQSSGKSGAATQLSIVSSAVDLKVDRQTMFAASALESEGFARAGRACALRISAHGEAVGSVVNESPVDFQSRPRLSVSATAIVRTEKT